MISIQKISKRFGPLEVLKGLDLSFQHGGITAILGPNGSGKTTLIKCLLGMVLPDKGTIEIEGKSIHQEHLYRDHISYLPQIARFPENLKVAELLKMLRSLRPERKSQAKELISALGLTPFLDKRLGHLSGGTRQKVNLVQAFMFDNPIVILDEPTAGLDPIALLLLKDWIKAEKEKGKIILITTHIMPFVAEMADEIVFLMDGNIHFRGSPNHLLQTQGVNNIERAIAGLLQSQKETSQAPHNHTITQLSNV